MRTGINTHTFPIIARAKEVWSELDYAQRRTFEIRTGVPVLKPKTVAGDRRLIAELESLYAYEGPDSAKQ